ncbi:MAG: lipopolysaccharide assembly protein LapA domain-containing protein [Candidatus Sphingomonas colombiensis]|nr:lipopolysaccharide assembly protein LapA domain-containing protein [Sphingomonas sp.]WEK42651.1 MAG: lipopolysaccharide assembly protein LapA domain-containing protein [Sphingomonas sp.]
MQFLKILFWCLIAFIAAVFTFGNWKWVTIQLFGNLVAEVNLPFLLLVTFAIGFVPTLIYQRAMRWRLRLRLNNAERTLADLRAAPVVAQPVEPIAVPATIASPGEA